MTTGTEIERADVARHVPATGAASVSLIDMTEDQFVRMKGVATALAQSGVFKDATGPPVAFAKMVVGRELGLGIAQSLTGLHLVEGTVQMHYSTMLAAVRSRGWKYRIPEHTNEKCRMVWIDPDGEIVGESEYTIDDAVRAEIVVRREDGSLVTKHGKRSMYAKVPKNMLLARATSNGVKAYVPEALGGMPVYVTGEVEPEERSVDGLPGGAAIESAVDLDAVLADVDDPEVRERLLQAYLEARNLRPGTLSPAVLQMAVKGQPTEFVLRYVERVEGANEEARKAAAEEPVDATVVEEETVDVEALRVRLSGLLDRRADVEENPGDETETAAELDALGEEIEMVERQLREAGGEVPGQGALDV